TLQLYRAEALGGAARRAAGRGCAIALRAFALPGRWRAFAGLPFGAGVSGLPGGRRAFAGLFARRRRGALALALRRLAGLRRVVALLDLQERVLQVVLRVFVRG